MIQGKTCCYCGNPDQTNESHKKWVYAGFGCDLGAEGRDKSRVWKRPSLFRRLKEMIFKAIEK